MAHSIFGVPSTINCANYAYLALSKIMKLNNAKTVEIFTEEVLNLHRGQGQDILSSALALEAVPAHDPRQDRRLIPLSCSLMLPFAKQNSDTDFTTLINLLAEYFKFATIYVDQQ